MKKNTKWLGPAVREALHQVGGRTVAIVASVAMLGTMAVVSGTALANGENSDTSTVQTNTTQTDTAQTAQSDATQNTTQQPATDDQADGAADGAASDAAVAGSSDATDSTNSADTTTGATDSADASAGTDAVDATTDGAADESVATAVKEAEATPAPAAETKAAADGARANLPTVETIDNTTAGINLSLNDFDTNACNKNNNSQRWNCGSNINYQQSRYQSSNTPSYDRNFQFGPTASNNMNNWTGENGGLFQNIVRDNLSNGYPQLTDTYQSDSLAYLFNSEQANGKTVTGSVNHLFQLCDKDGNNCGSTVDSTKKNTYYTYDSSKNFASLQSDKTFKVYNTARYPYLTSSQLTGSKAAFLPYNDLGTYDSANDNYNLANGTSADYYFGMSMSADFIMPKNGQVDGSDMVFSFEGDDDVWVYIDGKLALDLGGIHDNYGGSINFATGEITYGTDTKNTQPTSLSEVLGGNDWKTAYSKHTISFFYLERGAGASNCKLSFNLPTIPSGTINVGKEITDSNTDVSDAKFKMKVEIAQRNDQTMDYGNYTTYTGSYVLYDSNTNQPVSDTLQTAEDGTFEVPNGQYARLTSDSIKATTKYKVYELEASGYDKNDYTFELSDADYVDKNGNTVAGQVGSTTEIMVGDLNYVIVKNKFQKNDKYAFVVKKVMANGQTAASDTKFKMTVTTASGTPYANAEYYLSNDGGKTFDTTKKLTASADGVIELKAGQAAKIIDVAAGSSFKVTETDLDTNTYKDPAYACAAATDAGCTSGANGQTVVVDKTTATAEATPTITVTNSRKTVTLPASALYVRKHLEGANKSVLPADAQFCFKLEPVTAGAPMPGNLGEGSESKTVCVTKANFQDENPAYSITKTFGDIVYPAASDAQGVYYTYKLTELPDNKVPGFTYDTAPFYIQVRVTNTGANVSSVGRKDPTQSDQSVASAMAAATSDDSSEDYWDKSNIITVTNTWSPVESLPLTGGSTGRDWLLAGGGLGVLALLACGSYTVWRKRRLV